MDLGSIYPVLRGPRGALLVDGAVAVALTVLTQLEIGASRPQAHMAMLLTLSLAFRRRAPLGVAMLAAVAVAAQGLTSAPPSVFGEYVAITLVAYTVAAHDALPRAVTGLLLLAGGIVLHDLRSPEYGSVGGVASDLMTPIAFWGIGLAVRVAYRRARAARSESEATTARAAELARAAVADERRRLARELHDIVTHSLGVMVLHAQGGNRVLGDRDPAVSEALMTIERSGRSALDEMRRLLGLLRDDSDHAGLSPPPRLADLHDLVARVSRAGLPVQLRIEGDAIPLEPGVELSAYRVIQEALTNGLKHAAGARTEVAVRYTPTGLELDVCDDGALDGTDAEALAGSGRGLVGMRERVSFYGGTLQHGPRPEGGFRVHALFPLRTPA